MLNPNFKNGEKIDLHSALALFVVMMGFLFLLDAAPGTHTIITLLTILSGVAWYLGHQFYLHWRLTHPHG